MTNWIRILLIAAATWAGSLVGSLVLLFIVAGITQKWSTGRMQIVAVLLLAAMVIIFSAGTLFVHKEGSRTIFTLLYSGAAIITVVILGFITLMALNR